MRADEIAQTPRKIKDGPFCWQSKDALRLIRDAFDSRTFLSDALAVYVVLTEIASDEQAETFQRSRRAISERAGISLRQLDKVLDVFKSIGTVAVVINQIQGTKELAPSSYTLRTVCATPSTPNMRLRTGRKREVCKDIEQSPEESPEESKNKVLAKLPELNGL
jgi:hypothetical protein